MSSLHPTCACWFGGDCLALSFSMPFFHISVSYNADEVGIKKLVNVFHVCTSRKEFRAPHEELGKLSMMLTTNAAGEQAPPLFIFPENMQDAVTPVGFESWVVRAKNSYMCLVVFRQWICLFGEWLKSTWCV